MTQYNKLNTFFKKKYFGAKFRDFYIVRIFKYFFLFGNYDNLYYTKRRMKMVVSAKRITRRIFLLLNAQVKKICYFDKKLKYDILQR